MERPTEPLRGALATLQTRWGSAIIRLGDGRVDGSPAVAERVDTAVHGALALAVHLDPRVEEPRAGPDRPADVISTGFPDLDAILGPAGLPREASVVVRGGPSSGKTTLALRCVAEAQAAGDIVAWLDLARAFDPVEAVGRGVDLRWLLVIRPADVVEGLALAGSLLSGRCLGLLVVDLPVRRQARLDAQLGRLVAHARRTGARLVVLEPTTVSGVGGTTTLDQASGLRLELERRAWLRLGRDVVGQRTTATVAKNRYGPPGRSTDLDIRYLPDGERAVATQRLASAVAGLPAGLGVPGLGVPATASPVPAASGSASPAPVPAGLAVPGRGVPGPRLVVA
jgi:RecA/RadA recombinase